MVKEIVKDVMFLSRESEIATKSDISTANDLLDTLKANSKICVGMAANMIGVSKRIIAVNTGMMYIIMFNPEIIEKTEEFVTEEGCLSLLGVRKTKRYKKIKVKYQDKLMKWHKQNFSGYTAQIIQHEIDHLSGIII